MWLIHIIHWYFDVDFHYLGIYPRHINGLQGVLTTIFVHSGFEHLLNNSIPLLLLGTALFLYYPEFAFRLLIYLSILTGIYVWILGRESWHIGASGLVYALASFHILSAILRKEMKLLSFSMLVVFLYGGMVWGFFPEFFPKKNISFESHIMGSITGLLFAWKFRKIGLQREEYPWDEDDDEDVPEEERYWEVRNDELDKHNDS